MRLRRQFSATWPVAPEYYGKVRLPAEPSLAASLADGPKPAVRIEADVLHAGRHGEPPQDGAGTSIQLKKLAEGGAAARDPQAAGGVERRALGLDRQRNRGDRVLLAEGGCPGCEPFEEHFVEPGTRLLAVRAKPERIGRLGRERAPEIARKPDRPDHAANRGAAAPVEADLENGMRVCDPQPPRPAAGETSGMAAFRRKVEYPGNRTVARVHPV